MSGRASRSASGGGATSSSNAPAAKAPAASPIKAPLGGSAKKKTPAAAPMSLFAAAAQPMGKRPLPKAMLLSPEKLPQRFKCPECQCPVDAKRLCPNLDCHACPNRIMPTRGAKANNIYSGLPSASVATLTAKPEAKRPTSPVAQKPTPKKQRKRIVMSSSEDDNESGDESEVEEKKTTASSSAAKKPSTSPSAPRSRAAKPQQLIDPDAMSDDDDDDTFKPPTSAKRKSAPLSSTKINARDTDLALALALSRSEATSEQIEQAKAIEVQTAHSIWEERPNDPRHLTTLATGVFVVHPSESTPEGFVRERAQPQESSMSDDADTDNSQPILLRSGFISASVDESRASIQARADAFDVVWRFTERRLRSVIQAGEVDVYQSIEAFLTQAFVDHGPSTLAATDLSMSTNSVPIRPVDGEPRLGFHSRPLPVALVSAGLNVEDHAMSMEGLRASIVETAQRTRQQHRQARRARKKQKKEAPMAPAASEAKKKSDTPTKAPKLYIGLSQLKKIDATAEVEEESSGGSDSEADGETIEYAAPSPFVILLPPAPQSLVGLLRALFVAFVDAYPPPRTGTHSRADTLLSKRQVEKTGPDGGVPYLLDKLTAWNLEWREFHQHRYYQWIRQRTAAADAAQAASADAMDVDDDASGPAPASAKAKSPSKKRARTSAGTQATLPSAPPAPSSDPFADTSAYPSSIYPRLLLLIPSLDRFPAHVLQQFLALLLDHPHLKHADARFPFGLVLPVSSTALVHDLLPSRTLDRLWFGTFALPPAHDIMRRLMDTCFRGADGGHLPIQIGTEAITFLTRHFYTHNTSLATFMRVIKYILLDQCDAGYKASAATPAGVSSGCQLTAGYLRAWVKQHQQMASRDADRTSSSSDAVRDWVDSLSPADLKIVRDLPSMANRKLAKDESALRQQLHTFIDDLQVHQLVFTRAARIVHKVLQMVGASSSSASALPSDSSRSQSSSELATWQHLLSHPLFAADSANKAAAASSTDDSPPPSAFEKVADQLNRFERPAVLKSLLQAEVAAALKEATAEYEQAQRMDEEDGRERLTTLWYRRAVDAWRQQIDLLEGKLPLPSASASAGPSVAALGSAAAVLPASSGRTMSAGAGARRRDLLLKTATASAQGAKAITAGVLLTMQTFVGSMLVPVHLRPLSELVCFDDRRAPMLAYLFQPQPEATIFTALTQPKLYLDEANQPTPNHLTRIHSIARASAASTPAFPSADSEDMAVAFHIFQSMNGVFVNLADWFAAFKQTLRPTETTPGMSERAATSVQSRAKAKGAHKSKVGGASSSGAASSSSSSSAISPLSDAALQVRFLTCLTTLANLGYLKSTNRRVDHVIKLTLHRPI